MSKIIRSTLDRYLGGKSVEEAKETKKQVDELLRLSFKRNFSNKLYFEDMTKFHSIYFTTVSSSQHGSTMEFRGEIADKFIGKLTAYQIALLCWGSDNWFGGDVTIRDNQFSVTIYTD